MKDKIEKFEDLKIWQQGVELAVNLYKELVDCKDYGLRDQLQRSAVSVPSNIAEGFDRHSNKEFIRYLRIAKSSCAELRTQLIIADRINLFESKAIIDETIKLSAMIQTLITYREKQNHTA